MSSSDQSDKPFVPPWVLAVGAVLFSMVVILGFAVQNAAEIRAQTEILRELRRFSSGYQVVLNDRAVEDGEIVVEAVKRVQQIPAHHSHPMDPIRVRLTDGNHWFEFVIARDSARADEYWVFRPGRNLQGDPRGQHAGSIRSERVSNFLRQHGY